MLGNNLQVTLTTTNPPLALVVDDDPAHRLMLQTIMTQAGLTVKEAENGAIALSLFERFSPDIVLMDVKMPIMDGITACAKIRQLADGQDVPIILITGFDDHECIKQSFDVDATDFITKPVNWSILSHRIDYFLKSGKAIKALRRSELRLSNAQKIAELGCWDFDLTTNRIEMSEQVFYIFGEDPHYCKNTDFIKRKVHFEDISNLLEVTKSALTTGEPYSVDYRVNLSDGSQRYIHEQAEIKFSESGAIVGMYGTVQNITVQKMAEQKIRHLAYYDSLTGLPNRYFFKIRTKRVLERAMKNGTKVAIMFLDLDNFKRVNDVLGHDIGDILLTTVAEKLTTVLRVSDFIATTDCLDSSSDTTISRLGGDEFTLLLDGFTEQEQVCYVAQRVKQSLSQPITIKGHELIVTGSIGIAIFPNDGTDSETLLKNADIAMYQAKKLGRNAFHFYSKNMDKNSSDELNLEIKLRKAIISEQLVLHYQPQIETTTGKVIGLEALVRWQDPEIGLISPNDFIPLAEKSGLILAIGEWLLLKACRQTVAWQNTITTPFKISVNLSSKQFCQPGLADFVKRILSETNLSPNCLELEITENSLMDKMENVLLNLESLKKIGISIAIDDFGTGYSSLSYLKRLPIDTLKIDKSFIDDMAVNESDGAIVKAIIELANSLALNSIAEGVESAEQLALLTRHGCDQIQGYFFSKPLPADQVEEFLIKHS